MHPHKKSKLVYSSKCEERTTILSFQYTPSIEKIWKVRFHDGSSYKRLIINKWGYHYKPSEEWKRLNFKFGKKIVK
jgi:hypothetical protein